MAMLKIAQMRWAWLATAAAALTVMIAFAGIDTHPNATAGGTCSKQCDEVFKTCYSTSGGDRSACEEAKRQCMETCVTNGG